MKAIVYTKYGSPDVLQIKDVEKPIPKFNEVMIKIFTTSVTKYDCWVRSCTAPKGFGLLNRLASGIRKPKIPIIGTELAGEIEMVGKNVTQFKQGDQVFGFTEKLGAYAEYITLPENSTLALKSTKMTHEEAAGIPQGALTALYFLRKANIKKGQKILIFGASGGIGIYAVQLAKYFGAEVTGVCSSEKIELVKSIGANSVIDYTQEDFTKLGDQYDIIFDTVGKSPFSGSQKSLKKRGIYILATFGLGTLFRMLWLKIRSKKKIIIGLVEGKSNDLSFLTNLFEAGTLKIIIDKIFMFDQVIEAHKYVETGQKKGNVIIKLKED